MNERLKYVSASKLREFLTCPQRVKYRYVDEVDGELTKAQIDVMRVGSVFHAMVLEDAMPDEYEKLTKTFQLRVVEMAEALGREPLWRRGKGEAETEMNTQTRDGVELKGFFDFVGEFNGEQAILELKTTGSLRMWNFWLVENKIQPIIYPYIYWRMNGVILPFYYAIVTTGPKPKTRFFRKLCTERDFVFLEEQIKLCKNSIDNDFFVADPEEEKCDCCPYFKMCPSARQKEYLDF